jgi:sulfoquinovosyltransferase
LNNNNNNNNKTRLCLVGSGPEEEELREYFQGTSTTFLGRLDGLELSQAFASGDIFVMPSDSETLGFVVLESMASGVPCIAARAGGLIDLVDHGITGCLVPTGDVDAFCDEIERLRNHPDLYRRISVAGRQETERWSWYESMEQLRRNAYPQAIQNVSLRLWKRALRWFR